MQQTLERNNLNELFKAILKQGYEIIGPRVRDGAIIYDTLYSAEDLPEGITDEQEAGTYRLKQRQDKQLFGYVVGPHSWKRYLFPPEQKLWSAQRHGKQITIVDQKDEEQKYAFIGVRSCELHAMDIQDQVFINGTSADARYQKRRESAFLIAVNCGMAGATCFCSSMQTGPEVTKGYDLVLTEILDGERHYFVLQSGSAGGEQVLKDLPLSASSQEEIAASTKVSQQATQQMGRQLDTTILKDLLYRNFNHPQWDNVASRCISCANCTMVCPTCFCSTVEDVTELSGEDSSRVRKWDSCFSSDFSYIHGGSVRESPKSRYRQWMTHKLSTWFDQFGSSGCVGCGRCITWCPTGIDITDEVRVIRETDGDASLS